MNADCPACKVEDSLQEMTLDELRCEECGACFEIEFDGEFCHDLWGDCFGPGARIEEGAGS